MKNNKFQSEAFHFKENFNRQSANEYLKQYDEHNIKQNKYDNVNNKDIHTGNDGNDSNSGSRK